MSKPPESFSSRPPRKRERAMPKGRPFPEKTSGNPRGRPPKKKLTAVEAIMRPLMAPMVITMAGKRRRVPRLEAIGEQHVQAILQKDQGATRSLAALIRAVTGLVAAGKAEAPSKKGPTKNHAALKKIMKDHERRLIDADRRKRLDEGAD